MEILHISTGSKYAKLQGPSLVILIFRRNGVLLELTVLICSFSLFYNRNSLEIVEIEINEKIYFSTIKNGRVYRNFFFLNRFLPTH